jgi:glycosyltransferase involved in cell wall biosynthesis
MSGYTYTFTVFTPTFNRAHTLPRVYAALERQTFRDFEWLIVDDGSTDDTAALVTGWQAQAAFPIRYVWQENGGKHVAVNHGVRVARGRLFLFLDSDNACVPEALERLNFHWESIPAAQRRSFSAVSSLAQDTSGRIIGSRFPADPTDSDSFEIRYRYGITGEKWGFHRTDVLKEFPYPVFPGEKTMPESFLWNRIAVKYKTRYVNEPLEIYHQTPNSWSRHSACIRASSPKGTHLYLSELIPRSSSMPPRTTLRTYANYVRFSYHAAVPEKAQLASVPSWWWWMLGAPIGIAAYVRDRLVLFRSSRLSPLRSNEAR